MSVFHNNALIGSGAGTGAAAAAEYVIPKSLRFNDGDSPHLKRVISADGNKRTWTFSAWVKRASLGVNSTLFGAYFGGSSRYYLVRFKSDDTLQIFGGIYTTGGSTSDHTSLVTNQVFRDPSAFFHIVIAQDSTQSTAADRVKVYINSQQITSFSSSTYPSQNSESFINAANATHYIGQYGENQHYFDGQIADIQLVDGQQLAPTNFGETRSSDGVWVPKEYTTTFQLASGTPTTANGGIVIKADDSSINGTFVVNGGVKTWTSPDGQTWTRNGDGRSTAAAKYLAVGGAGTATKTFYPDTGSGNYTYFVYNGNEFDGSGSPFTLDLTSQTYIAPSDSSYGISGWHLNFSDSSTIEALGFDSAPTIPDLDPKKGFDVVTYTGNGASTPGGSGSTQNVGGLAFEPGLLWIKDRTQSGHNHNLIDVINQPPNLLMSDSTAALTTNSTDGVTSFNPDGFTLGANSSGSQSLEMNKSGNSYVAWAWKANGPAVPNTSGTITSQVSASTEYGFSVVKYTGTGSNATVGHSLGAAPGWILVKTLDDAYNWFVYHKNVDTNGEDYYLRLNNGNPRVDSSAAWNDTAPTSTLFSIGTDGSVNESGDDYIAYCWTEIANYSKLSGYSGSGSANQKVTGLGFKPRFLIIKRTDILENWQIVDSERGSTKVLYPDLTDNESTASSREVTFQDDGFTLVGTHAGINASGGSYVYAAFADRPGNNWDVNSIVTNEGLTTSKDNFDVVTYTGNGGAQSIGGPVYSVTSNLSNPANAFDGSTSTGSVFNSTGNSVLTAGSMTITSSLEIFHNRTGSDGITLNINGTNYTATGLSSNGYHTIPIPGSDLPLTTTGNITIKDNQSGAQSTVYAVRVDGAVLRDNTGHALNFQPDFIWIKPYSPNAQNHFLYDSVRGIGRSLRSSNNADEKGPNTGTDGDLRSFDTNGFTLGSGAGGVGAGAVNNNNESIVAWCWKAGGAAVSNTDGSITSSVSAGDGFSVVTWTGTASAGTIGHGLNGKVPQFIITKRRDSSGDWYSQHASLGATHRIQLNSSSAATSGTSLWNSTGPTGSVFSVGADNEVNASGGTFVAYCFANVPGRQRVGSYPGSGSAVTVITGFKPRFILVRSTSNARDWLLWDSERGASGGAAVPNLSNTPYSDSTYNGITFNTDGFTIMTGASTPNMSASGETYIYLAIGDDEIGSDEDCLVDVPNAVTADADATDTTGGYQRGNYATLNPLDSSGTGTFSNGNLEALAPTSGNSFNIRATIAPTSGKWYWEYTMLKEFGIYGGIVLTSFDIGTSSAINGNGGVAMGGGSLFNGGSNVSSSPTQAATGDVMGFAWDVDNSSLEFFLNGVSQGTVSSIADGQYAPAVTCTPYSGGGGNIAANFGQMRFKYPIPSGYAALNTTALPAATIADGSAHFEARTYTANATARSLTGYEFAPDWLWFKPRGSGSHNLYDSVRGATKGLRSHSTDSEYTDAQTLTSFNSDGFSLGTDSGGYQVNYSTNSMIVWAWNAGANSNKTYTVKVVSDSGNKYRFDDFGSSAVTLDLEEGSTYVFDQSDSSNAGHPIRFGTSANGTDYTTGVTHTGTPGSAGAKTTLVLGTGVSTLYYSCLNHSGMGGQINTNSTAGASNFDGTIQTTVKTNPEAGFSIAIYSGSGTSGDTLGHGLNAEPEFAIVKARTKTDDWRVYHKGAGTGHYLRVNGNHAKTTTNNWQSPSSTTLGLDNDSAVNSSSYTYLALFFAPVAGYSAFGSYEGNGSSDGPFVYTGHLSRWVLIKRIDSAGNWSIYDTARDPENVQELTLLADTTGSESTDANKIDIVSNGFKPRASNANINASGGSYVFVSFASNPFSANGGLAR